MRVRMFFGGILFILLSVPVISWGQFGTYELPTESSVTGIDFYSPERGIITTGDSLVFLVTKDDNGEPEFYQVDVLYDDHHPIASSTYQPLWLNDSTVFVATSESVGGDKYYKISTDSGHTWSTVFHFLALDFLGDTRAVNDTTLFVVMGYDNIGQISLEKYNHRGNYVEYTGFGTGDNLNFHTAFIPLSNDSVLFSAYSDSLYVGSISTEEVTPIATNLSAEQWSPLFTIIEQTKAGTILGAQETTAAGYLFRSTDRGATWDTVYTGTQIQEIKATNRRVIWMSDHSNDTLSLYRSPDDGLTWESVNQYAGYSHFDPVNKNDFWVGGNSDKVIYGHYPISHTTEEDIPLPMDFRIAAYPNPFNSTVTIQLQNITPETPLSVDIYNILGQHVATLFKGMPQSATLQLRWNTSQLMNKNVGSGIYFVRAATADRLQTKKIILVE